jgi:PAS domain S-box-containing protein
MPIVPPTSEVTAAIEALGKLAAEANRVSALALDALRTSESRYRRLFEAAHDGILLLNAETAQVEDVNPFLIKMLDYSHEEFLGKKLWEVGAFADIAESQKLFLELQANDYIRYEDLPLKTKSGAMVEVEFISNAYDCEGVRVIQCNIRDISQRKRAEGASLRYLEQLKVALMNTVEVATIISEMRDPYTAKHERRSSLLAGAIGAELGFDEVRQEGLRVAGALHDIGMISIPSEILSKPGKISRIEMELIKAHAQAGYDVLSRMEWPWPVAEVAIQHHERMDGSGYPNGLTGNQIIPEARIMAVADVVEAMSSHRPYRAALGIDRTLAEIESGSGTLYDTDVVNACLRLFREKNYQFPA